MNKLGKYQIRRTLGQGAMGIVYEGFDPAIERIVAIKTILPSQLGADYAGIMARFKREAQAAGRLNHPGIVAIYDYGEEIAEDISDEEATMMAATGPAASGQRVAYIAMEFVRGRELKDAFTQGERFPLATVAHIMTQVLDALDHAHAQGVVHRDIKPANLIVLPDGRVKIADFGIARIEASELTQAGAVLGTPSYMSPEQFMGAPVDGRSDLFSCGVILYQLLTGEKPFTGESSTTIMYKVLREEPVPPSELNVALPAQLDAVVRKALAKSPADRFANGHEFAQALQAALATHVAPSPSAVAGAATVPFAATAAPAAAPGGTATVAVPTRARPALAWWGAGAAAAVVLGAGAYWWLAPSHQPGAPLAQGSPATTAAIAPAAQPVPAAPAAVAAAPTQPGTLVISAVGLADPQDTRFKGDMAAAQAEARSVARRQLIEKALALYVEPASLDGNRGLIERKLLANSDAFIRSVLQEGTAAPGKGGLMELQTRAVISMRDLQKSLNQLSREERVDFIRRRGDPRISIRIDVAGAAGPMGRERSLLAENVVKERIKSFGFRVWADGGDTPAAPDAQAADFAIRGEVKLKQLSTRLPASGLTITKAALTSWTLKATETGTGEEVYLSTKLPTGQSWPSEEHALAAIGQLVGDEFSRNFFLQHVAFRTQKTTLMFTGLPEGGAAMLLRELRGMRAVLDAQLIGEPGRFQLQLADGSAPEILQQAIVAPLNRKLGSECFTLAVGAEPTIAYAASCATAAMRARLETGAPAGWPAMPGGGSTAPRTPTAAPLRNSA